MKIKVDKSKCIQCGTCVALYPKYFKFDENNKAEANNDEVAEDIAGEAIATCPVEAISSSN